MVSENDRGTTSGSNDLTAEQQKKITALYTDFEKKRVAGSEASREQMRAERQELDKQVSAVLTDTQKAKLDEMRKARRSGGFRGKKEGK